MDESTSTESKIAKLYKIYFVIGVIICGGLNIIQTVRIKIIGSGYEM